MPPVKRRRRAARCSVPECNKQVQTRRLCKAHGGGVRCRGPNCTKLAQSRGMCVAHGGGRRCDVEGCGKLAQYKGLCLSHGGGRYCSFPGCQKFVQLRGCCKAHLKMKEAQPPPESDPTVPDLTSAESRLAIAFTGTTNSSDYTGGLCESLRTIPCATIYTMPAYIDGYCFSIP